MFCLPVFLGLFLGVGDIPGQEGIQDEGDRTQVASTGQEIETVETVKENPVVILKTTKGDITIELNQEKAPLSVANFLQYVDSGHYNGTIFHRVIDGFMIQGGGFTEDIVQKPTRAPVKNEASNGLKNEAGSIAMARTPAPDSATCQFFINVVKNAGLDYPSPDGHGYAVFGKVVDGMDVVNAIKSAKTGFKKGMQDVPIETIEITEAVRKTEE
ncbi:MAG: peptidylprolyl isomerase [Verrucomicrobia bacterium]|nr:peptidylprolyl isomerase [Verrucomicrobiota bacterium]